jgi:hypothetical protein
MVSRFLVVFGIAAVVLTGSTAAAQSSSGEWQAYADVDFRASDLVSVILGFRAIDIDYEDGSGRDLFRYDILVSGPQIGVAFTL